MRQLDITPITITEAYAFVHEWHRHRARKAAGALFAIACAKHEQVCGVVLVGHPVSRIMADGFTAEVIRLATNGEKNVCSMLYAAAWRASRAMGYRRLISYILQSETGTSLRAAGWKEIAAVRGKTWHTKSRPRVDRYPLQGKIRYEVCA